MILKGKHISPFTSKFTLSDRTYALITQNSGTLTLYQETGWDDEEEIQLNKMEMDYLCQLLLEILTAPEGK